MKLLQIFNKQGGLNLLKQYHKSGALFTAVGEILLLGKSRTSLEILRLSTELKTKNKLERKYRKVLNEFDISFDNNLEHKQSDKVWICWFQGMENAPKIVQKCYESVKNNLANKEIVLITENNMMEYVDFPDYVLDKWKNGIITDTHMTDLLRLELLIRYGGIWLDATVYCSNNNIPNYYFDSDLFFYQTLKPGRDGNAVYMSSWLISAKSNNKILMATLYLCYAFWKNNSFMWDYFLLHDFMFIVLDKYKDDWDKIIPRDNATPHELLLRLFEEYDVRMWNAIINQTPFHKLTYKFSKEEESLQNTFYKKVLKNDFGRLYI